MSRLPKGIWVQVGTIPGKRDTSILSTREWRVLPRPVYARLVQVVDDTVLVEHRSEGRPAKAHRFVSIDAAMEYVALEYECRVHVHDAIDELLSGVSDAGA